MIATQTTHENLKPSRRVLIVDNDMDTATSIKYIVESYGNSTCKVVRDPYEALLALSDFNFDFVFVDQQLPGGIDGSTVLSKIDEHVNKDPLIAESGRYMNSIPAVLLAGAEVKLQDNYKLENFDLVKISTKKDLSNFLSLNFAS